MPVLPLLTHPIKDFNAHVLFSGAHRKETLDAPVYSEMAGIQLAPYNVLHSHMASVLHGSQMTLEKARVLNSSKANHHECNACKILQVHSLQQHAPVI